MDKTCLWDPAELGNMCRQSRSRKTEVVACACTTHVLMLDQRMSGVSSHTGKRNTRNSLFLLDFLGTMKKMSWCGKQSGPPDIKEIFEKGMIPVLYERDIERCVKDECSLFGSRLCSNRESNCEYKSFGQSSISILLYGGCFCRDLSQNSRQIHHAAVMQRNCAILHILGASYMGAEQH